MNFILKVNGSMRKFEEILIVLTVTGMSVLLIGAVISRKVLQNSWTFSEEMGGFLMVWVTYFGAIYAARFGKHIIMNVLIDALRPKAKKILLIFTASITGLFLFYATYLSFDYLKMVYDMQRITPALRIPLWIPLTPMVFGLLMTGVQFLLTAMLNIIDKNNIYIGSERKIDDKDASSIQKEVVTE